MKLSLLIISFPTDMQHKFTSDLKSVDCVEDDKCEFKIAVEEDDAEVKWFKDGIEIIPDGKRYVIELSLLSSPALLLMLHPLLLPQFLMKHSSTHHSP